MRIGVIHSGYEMLPLFQVVNHYEHEWHIFCDWSHGPRGDKSPSLVVDRVQAGIDYLADKVDVLILPPVYELSIKTSQVPILPLFQTYLLEYVLKYSLVGKLGLLCEAGTMTRELEQLIHHVANNYELTIQQQQTKSFHTDFPLWKKAVPMRKYFLTTYGRRDWMVRKTLKYDLRYFHDAAVDTLVPLDRGMLFWQRIIRQRINRKKMRFHGLDAVQDCFERIITSHGGPSSAYSMTIHCTDTPTALLEERKWMDMLGRGKDVRVVNV